MTLCINDNDSGLSFVIIVWKFMSNKCCFNNKMFFTTNIVVYVLPGAGSKRQKRKTRSFTTKELLGIKIIEWKFT